MEIPVRRKKYMKEIPFKGRKFISQERNSCHSKDISIIEGNYWHMQEIPVTRREFLSQEKSTDSERNLLTQEGYSFRRKDIPAIGGHSC